MCVKGGHIHLPAFIQRPQFLGPSSGLYGQVPLYVLQELLGVLCVSSFHCAGDTHPTALGGPAFCRF